MTLEVLRAGGKVLDVDPYKGIIFNRKKKLLQHSCGGNILLFAVGSGAMRLSWAKKNHKKHNRKTKESVKLTEEQAFKIILALPGGATERAYHEVGQELMAAGKL
jgi:hypothetical protein